MRDDDGGWRKLAWAAVRRISAAGKQPTHPELFAARDSHTLYARPGRHIRRAGDGTAVTVVDVAEDACDGCARWPMWRQLTPVDGDTWYGFGGAWGEVGPTSRTTGPLGPHGASWPAGNLKAQLKWRSRSW